MSRWCDLKPKPWTQQLHAIATVYKPAKHGKKSMKTAMESLGCLAVLSRRDEDPILLRVACTKSSTLRNTQTTARPLA